MSEAGFLGGEPFDLLVEEDFLGTADGGLDARKRLEGGQPEGGGLEGFLHFPITDGAATEVESGE